MKTIYGYLPQSLSGLRAFLCTNKTIKRPIKNTTSAAANDANDGLHPTHLHRNHETQTTNTETRNTYQKELLQDFTKVESKRILIKGNSIFRAENLRKMSDF